MRILSAVFASAWMFVASAAHSKGIGCPSGTTPKGETTPEITEAWCEIFRDGKTVQHGPYRSWYPSGKRSSEGQYEYGVIDGHWRGWYETGELQGEEWYERGKKVKERYLDKKGHEIPKPDES